MPRKPAAKPAAEIPAEDVEVEDLLDEVEEDADVEVEDDTEVEAEVTDDDVDDLEVEDVEDEPEPAPKKTRAKKAADGEEKPAKPPREVIEYGSAWLAEHVNAEAGTTYNAFAIRTLLRRLVKEGLVKRDVGEDRSRYNFTGGAKDPVAVAVVKYVKSGADEAAKKAKIAEAKAAAAAKKAAEAPAESAAKPARKTKAKAAPAPEPEDDDEDEEIEDL